MKLAKTLAILVAMVLVVMCFNAPIVFSGEEHPWDGDGTGGDGLGGGTSDDGVDTTIVGPADNDPLRGSNPDDPFDPGYLISIQFLIWYHDLPGYVQKDENDATSGASR